MSNLVSGTGAAAAANPFMPSGLPPLPPLHAVFQPIVLLADGSVYGYEALIRGPLGSPLETPDALFRLARDAEATIALECRAARTALEAWAALDLPGRLFVNFSPLTLRHLLAGGGEAMSALLAVDGGAIAPARVVIEVTEQTALGDAAAFGRAMTLLAERGMQYALDDFGTGHANLDLLATLTPQFVKIDKSLVRGIATCSRRFEILRAVLRLMHAFGGRVIAEGIENADELAVVRDLGVTAAQGYYLGRPVARPSGEIAAGIRQALASKQIAVFPQTLRSGWSGMTAGRLLRPAPTVLASTPNNDVLAMFHAHPDLHALAVVTEQGRPLALINRQNFIDCYAMPFHRELYGRKACMSMANRDPACFDRGTSLETVAQWFAGEQRRSLADGFVITDGGRYLGLGTSADLLGAVTDIRMEAARYANPLTFLPGNILLNQHIGRLLEARSPFHACYVDLNHFKPFNDHYGYWKGDEMLKGAAAVLSEACDGARDFLGHIGGDDFLILFQGADWEPRIRNAMARFNVAAQALYAPDDRAAGGIQGEDRHGRPMFFAPVTMAAGVVRVSGHVMADARQLAIRRLDIHHIAAAAAAAKHAAKRAEHGLALLDLGEIAARGGLAE